MSAATKIPDLSLDDGQSYTVREAARLMRCSPNSVYHLIRTGHIHAYRVGANGRRIWGRVLRAYMAGDQTGAG